MTEINLSNLHKVNSEELVYFVAQHLLKQNKKSLVIIEDSNYESCAYRASDGKSKCAVGSVISDPEYSKEMEGKPPSTVYSIFFKKSYGKEQNYVSWRETIAEIENLNIYSSEDNEIIDKYQSNLGNNMCILEKMRVIHDNWNTESWECQLVKSASTLFSEELVKRIYSIER